MGFPLLLPARAAQAHASRRPQAAKLSHAPGRVLRKEKNTARAAQVQRIPPTAAGEAPPCIGGVCALRKEEYRPRRAGAKSTNRIG